MKRAAYLFFFQGLLLCFSVPGHCAAATADGADKTRAGTDAVIQDAGTRAGQVADDAQAQVRQVLQDIHTQVKSIRDNIPSPVKRNISDTRPPGPQTIAAPDPYDSQEAQQKAEAALLRTGPTGPNIIGITSSTSEIIPALTQVQKMGSDLSMEKEKVAAGIIPIEQALADLDARVTPTAIVVSLKDSVLFDFDKAVIKEQAAATLTRVAAIIREKGTGTVLIEGHTDSRGSEAYNQRLSEKRAAAVRTWLVRQGGIAGKRLQTRGYGESRPVAPNTKEDGSDNPEGRALNRRVVIRISTGNP